MASTNKKQQAQALKEQGMSTAEIASTLGISERTAYRWLSQQEEASASVSTESYSNNDKIDNRLCILFKRGQSTTYNCLGYIAQVEGLDLATQEGKEQATKLFSNARRRLSRADREFHIIPQWIAEMTNPQEGTEDWYALCEEIWWTIDTRIESFIFNKYPQGKAPNTQKLRLELAKSLGFVPGHNHQRQYETNTRSSEVAQHWKDNVTQQVERQLNIYKDVETQEDIQSPIDMDEVEAYVLKTTGITKDDIPY